MHDCTNSIANLLRLLQSCTKPSIYASVNCVIIDSGKDLSPTCGTKPFPKPIRIVKNEDFYSGKCIWRCRRQSGGHFDRGHVQFRQWLGTCYAPDHCQNMWSLFLFGTESWIIIVEIYIQIRAFESVVEVGWEWGWGWGYGVLFVCSKS